MAEYRSVRQNIPFLELCRNPDLCADVMLTAVDKLGVDAAILFSDLLVLLEPMGLKVEFSPQDGPIIGPPIREPDDLKRLLELTDVSPLDYVCQAVQKTRSQLSESLPLIGFAGAPFTLLAYSIEGGGSRDFRNAKQFMYTYPDAWHEAMGRFARSIARFLIAQIDAGCQIVQIFDSWVGCLGPDEYRQYVLPHSQHVLATVAKERPQCPTIHFGTGNPTLLPLLAEAGGRVIGVDWRISMADAWRQIGYDRSVQGNLDPTILLTNPDIITEKAGELLRSVADRPGFIFNLGHGVLPQTPVENAIALIKAVHAFKH